jgi:thioredoxin-related protein
MQNRSAFLLGIAALAFSALVWAAPGQDPMTHFFNETFGDFAEELGQAREDAKTGVMLFYEMDECPFCQFMRSNVLNQEEVQTFFREHFLLFPMDIDGDLEITDFSGQQTTQKELARQARVRATPVIAFYDLDGKEIFRHTGRVAGVEEFMLMGRFIVDGDYKKQKFTVYKREHLKK